MGEFFERHRAAFMAFFGLTVPLFLLFVHGRHPRKTTVVEVALMQITAPVHGAAATVLGGLSGLWSGYISLVDVEEENVALHQQVERLKAGVARAEQLELENGRLRGMLAFTHQRPELRVIAAHVVGRDVSPYARVVRISIDAAAADGVAEGMPVITPAGLVGRIHRVASDVAEVLLAVDARSTVSVKVLDKGVTGMVTGIGDARHYAARMTYLHKAEPLAAGDTLVTSGQDEVFPAGIRVGSILDLSERQRGVEYVLDVVPAVNFSDLSEVQIVMGNAVEAGADAAGRGARP